MHARHTRRITSPRGDSGAGPGRGTPPSLAAEGAAPAQPRVGEIEGPPQRPGELLAVQRTFGNDYVQRLVAGALPPVMRQGSGKPPPPQPLEIPGDELGRLIQEHLKPLPTPGADADDEMAKQALKTALKAFMETDAGKKLADALTSKKGLTTIAIALPSLVAALIAEKASAPTLPLGKLLEKIPGVPKGTELDFSLEGPLAKPTGGMLTFKLQLGDTATPAGKPGGAAPKPPLPNAVRAAAAAVDTRLITNSVVSPFLWEWETAGPDEEEVKAKPYREARDVRFTVDARLVAYRVAEAILGQPGKASVEVFAGDDWRWRRQQQKRWRDPETHRLASGLPKICEQLVDDMVRAIVAAGSTPQASAVEFTARPYVFAYVPVGT